MILLTDSYKLSHWTQYPPGMVWMQSYLESRGGEYPAIIPFGLQYLLKKYLSQVPTAEDIRDAAGLARAHGLPFNVVGWDRIAALGYLPVAIHAAPEGSICRPHDVLMTIESTDPQSAWLVSWLETLLLKVWYPSTVATKAYHVRQIVKEAFGRAGVEPSGFEYHNFGDRGSSSVEAAALGGAAHLTQFRGTDNFASLQFANVYYGVEGGCAGFSIPASEHSTVTSWGNDNEYRMIEAYLEANKGQPMIACVLDSYDLFSAVSFCCSLRTKIESDQYPIVVMRPDSGDPLEIIPEMLQIMERSNLAYDSVNGFKLFRKYRIIWGDGITPVTIKAILDQALSLGYSPANFAFGSGGDLMQKLDRDTCRFAIKCCAIRFADGTERAVFKKPAHDPAKASKMGRQVLPDQWLRFRNGQLFNTVTFDQVRAA